MRTALRVVATVFAVVALLGVALVASPATSAQAARPSGKSVSVKVVAAEGGTAVTITGKNLKKVNAVYFGATKATKITHLGTTKLRVTAPAHAPGTVKIKLRVGKKKYATSLRVRYVATASAPSAFEAEVLRLTNEQRVAGYTCTEKKTGEKLEMPPVPALSWSAKLASAARLHSADMAVQNYFDHTSLDGTTFSQRITKAATRGVRPGRILPPATAPPRRWSPDGCPASGIARTSWPPSSPNWGSATPTSPAAPTTTTGLKTSAPRADPQSRGTGPGRPLRTGFDRLNQRAPPAEQPTHHPTR